MRATALRLAGLALLCGAAPGNAQVADPATAERITLGTGIEGWHYLKRDDLSVIRMRFAPGASEDRHLHRKARLFVTVLTGTMTIEIGGKEHVVAAGQGVEVPPGTPHRASNRAFAPLELLVVAMPPTAGDREAVAP